MFEWLSLLGSVTQCDSSTKRCTFDLGVIPFGAKTIPRSMSWSYLSWIHLPFLNDTEAIDSIFWAAPASFSSDGYERGPTADKIIRRTCKTKLARPTVKLPLNCSNVPTIFKVHSLASRAPRRPISE